MHSAQCPPFLGFDTESTRRSYSVSEGAFPSSPAASFLSAFACPAIIPEVEEDAEGSVISGYTLGRIVGHGAFSTIRLASSSSSNGVVAVKIVQHGNAQNASTESTVWQDLCHEHLLPLFSCHTTPHATYHFTLYCPAGSLLDIMNRHAPSRIIPQDDAGTMFRQVVRGLRYLHEVAGYIHGDMKLDNVLVDEMGVCRITDFGLAKEILRSSQCESTEPSGDESELDDDVFYYTTRALPKAGTHHLSLMRKRGRGLAPPRPHRATTTAMDAPSTLSSECPAGSLPYAAPELLAPSHFQPGSQVSRFADPAQDMWALGVMLFALLTGKLPFVDPFEPRLIMKILRGTYTIPAEQKGIGRGAERLLKGCLEKSVKDRWSVDMVDELSWGVGWGEAAWEPEPDVKHDTEWEPAPTPMGISTAVNSRASSVSRSRTRDRHSHDPIPMTAESRSKSRSSRKRCSRDFDDEMMWTHSQAPSRSQSQSRSHSRRRSALCPPVPEDDDDDFDEEPPMRRPFPSIHLGMAEINRGRRPDRKPVNDSPELSFSALSISPTDSMPSTMGFAHSLSPSPSPSPTLASPSASLILSQPEVRDASSRRSSRHTRGRSREKAGVRFKESDFDDVLKT